MNNKKGTPLQYFEEISAIPRASGNEGAIADYLEAFAARHGLFCLRDGANNLLLRKAATKGRENEDTVLLQAHTDMVCERADGSSHDFATEGLHLVREGNLLFADGTTLGADDGFGVAMMLAILADKELSHPTLECLFTSGEEVGLCGARVFDYKSITAKRMINLDSAEEDTVIVGCCGGSRTSLFLPLQKEYVSGEGITVKISGLCGGHSGEDIHRGRANALLLMRDLLSELREAVSFRFAELVGGGKDNAIPRECTARIAVSDPTSAMACLQKIADKMRHMPLAPEDAGLCIEIDGAPYEVLWDEADTDRILELLSMESGVLEWRAPRDIPQTSRNTASVKQMGEQLRVVFSTRSPSKETLAKSDADLTVLAERVGAQIEPGAAYPGWESDEHSSFVAAWRNAYRDVTGGELKVSVIHAGLECGVICDAVCGLEAIAVGCNIHDLHSPRERMELDSFDRIFATLCRFLAQ